MREYVWYLAPIAHDPCKRFVVWKPMGAIRELKRTFSPEFIQTPD